MTPMSVRVRKALVSLACAGAFAVSLSQGALAQTRSAPQAPEAAPQPFSTNEIVGSGHKFFGSISRGLAEGVQEAVKRWGQPNAYILGQEGSAAFIVGGRYGEGIMYTRNAGKMKVYWQGPSLGFDAGADGARTMILVYNLPSKEAIFDRFGGIDGSAYLIGGFGFTALTASSGNVQVTLVPIRSGVGARLGLNLSYLKFTPESTWNPF